MTNEKNKPPGFLEVLGEVFSVVGKVQSRHAYIKSGAAGKNPPNYQQRCQEWAKKEGWILREAANLLARCEPQRPHDLEGQAQAPLNREIDKLYRYMLAQVGKDLPLLDPSATSEDTYKIRPITLIQWAANHDYQIPWELYVAIVGPIAKKVDGQRKQAPTAKTPQPSNSAAENVRPSADSYSTRLLKIQRAAIEKFWVNYDKSHPPSSIDIVGWIRSTHKTTNNEALAIDRIIRADERKRGGLI